MKKSNRQKSMFWKPIVWKGQPSKASATSPVSNDYALATKKKEPSFLPSTHPLVNQVENQKLRAYEVDTKAKFDNIEPLLKEILSQVDRKDFVRWANAELSAKLGVTLEDKALELNSGSNLQFAFQNLFTKIVFEQFLSLSNNFFKEDPLDGQKTEETLKKFIDSGIHALGVAPCADGRLAHFISYVLRLPYALVRRKAHAGSLFDISESVRNWVFIEHNRYRMSVPNPASEPTRYMKMAVYHFSKADPTHQGCAAHGSDDHKAAQAALTKLRDFRQAIENRFGCGSTIETSLIGLNTDNDSFRVHVPDHEGKVCLERYLDTEKLYDKTLKLTAEEARKEIEKAILECNFQHHATAPQEGVKKLLAWLIENNFSQIEYVRNYEKGCYSDIGHAERFISVGNGFEEVQLRNLSYYSYLDTLEEGVNDVDVGIKIFKGLNVKKGLPIPIIIRCNYDGRVPGSKTRAVEKAKRLEKAIKSRYQDLDAYGLIKVMGTLRDYTSFKPAEKLRTS